MQDNFHIAQAFQQSSVCEAPEWGGLQASELGATNAAELGIDNPIQPVRVGIDPAAKAPKVTVWRVGEDGQEYADVPMATPEDLERLQAELPLTDAQVAQLAAKISKRMRDSQYHEKLQKTRARKNKAAKVARRRNR